MSETIRLPEGVTLHPPRSRPAWRITWRTPNGQRRNLWRKHQPDALAVGYEISQQLAHAPPDTATHNQPLHTMLDRYADAGPATSTRTTRRSLTRPLPTWLLNMAVDNVTQHAVDQALNTIDTTARRRHQLYQHLRGAYQWGVDNGWAGHNPLPKRAYNGGRKRRRQGQTSSYVEPDAIPTTVHVERLADAAEQMHGWEWGVAIRLSAYAGLRIGEICGLAIDSIDLPNGTITVQRQYQVDDDGRIPHLHPPKGNKIRATVLPAFLDDDVAKLAEQRRTDATPPHPCPAGCDEAAPTSDTTVPLWPDERRRSTGWNPQSRVYQRFLQWRQTADWPRDNDGKHLWNWHALRHHFCTWALANPNGARVRGHIPSGLGLEVADVAHFAGHSSPSFTWQAYCHTRSGAIDRARGATA